MTSARHDRQFLHEELDRFLDLAERLFDNENDSRSRMGWANVLLRELLDIMTCVAGRDMLEVAYGENPDVNDTSDVLRALAHRISLAMDMFSSLEDHRNPHPSSLKAAFQETLAIAGGDAPQIFAQHQATRGHRTNAYRLARRQLAAFEWEAYFAERGDNVAIRRAKITSAFGVQWDTIRKWRSPIVLMLGTRDVEDSERYARLTAQQSWQLRGRKNNEIDALKFDGDAYRLELRRQKNSLEN